MEDHPEVVVQIEPDADGYEELQLQPRPPQNHKTTSTKSFVDTGFTDGCSGYQDCICYGAG